MCDSVVMANRERCALVRSWLGGELRTPIDVLENYPDSRFRQLPVRDLPMDVTSWLDGSPYLLAQGGANPDRHLDTLVAAVLRRPHRRLIVVGPYLAPRLDELRRAHGAALERQVLFTGPIPQMELARFIDHAQASVVLYQAHSENTRLCAPNRLYQALARGVPVLVGANPPMAELVRGAACGAVLTGDGGDVDDVDEGIVRLESGHDAFRRHAADVQGLLWESQDDIVARVVASLPLVTYENYLSAAGCDRR
jgi:glycosyltransferase involved in cell wall biosynthesis